MIGSEQHFIDQFGPKAAEALLGPMQAACVTARRLAAEHGFVESRTEPTVAFDLTVKGLADFDQLPGIRRAYSQQQHLWVINECYGLRVKKLGPGYRPSNHPSGQQTLISNFLPLDDWAPLIYVTAGVRYSTTTGLPEEFVVVKHYPGPTGRQCVEWVLDLEDLAGGATDATTPIFDFPSAPAAPAAVRRRRPDTGTDAAES